MNVKRSRIRFTLILSMFFLIAVPATASAALTLKPASKVASAGTNVRASDPAGNQDPTPATRSFTVDATPPAPPDTTPLDTTIDSGPANGATITADSVAFGFSSSEAGSTFECRLEPFLPDWKSCESPKGYRLGSSQATRVFKVRATDAAGNTDPSPATRTFTVDMTGTAADPPNTLTFGSWLRKVQTKGSTAKVTFSYACSTDKSFGDNTCGFFECRLDGGDFKRCPGGASDPGADEEVTYRIKATRSWKTHVFAVRVTDTNGKTDPTPVKHRFQVRRKVPFLGIKRAKSAVIKRQRRADRAYCKNRSCSFRSIKGSCKRRSSSKVRCRIVVKVRDRGVTYTCWRSVTVRKLWSGKLKYRWGKPRCRRS